MEKELYTKPITSASCFKTVDVITTSTAGEASEASDDNFVLSPFG